MKEQKKIHGAPTSSKEVLAGCFDYIRKHQLVKPCGSLQEYEVPTRKTDIDVIEVSDQ